MLRAISYTILFCGVSAGAALALAFVHETNVSVTVSDTSPHLAPRPTITSTSSAVQFAPSETRAEPTARVAPVLEPAPDTASVNTAVTVAQSLAMLTAPVVSLEADPMPKTQVEQAAASLVEENAPVATVEYSTTDGDTDVIPYVSTMGSGADETIFTRTWLTGVYR